jgi:hypothetical protein
MRTSVIFKEQILILSICLDPLFKTWIVQKIQISLCFEINAIVANEYFFKVSVVEYKWVHSPSAFLSLIVITGETECVRTHNGNILFRLQAHHIKLLDDDCVLMLAVCNDCECVRRLTLGLYILSAHLKEHRWSSTVLDGSVATQLDQIGVGKHGSDVITVILDLLDKFHSLIELRILSSLQFCVKSQDCP